MMENFSKLIYSGEIITDANDDSKTYKYTYINSYSSIPAKMLINQQYHTQAITI